MSLLFIFTRETAAPRRRSSSISAMAARARQGQTAHLTVLASLPLHPRAAANFTHLLTVCDDILMHKVGVQLNRRSSVNSLEENLCKIHCSSARAEFCFKICAQTTGDSQSFPSKRNEGRMRPAPAYDGADGLVDYEGEKEGVGGGGIRA